MLNPKNTKKVMRKIRKCSDAELMALMKKASYNGQWATYYRAIVEEALNRDVDIIW